LIYVVDASVVLKWFLPEPDNAAADFLLEQFLNGEAELIAPDLLLIETASALWKRATLRNELSTAESSFIYRDLLTLPISLTPTASLAEAAFQLAVNHRHSVYDAVYCALAMERGCSFITADQTIVNKLTRALPFIRPLSTIKP